MSLDAVSVLVLDDDYESREVSAAHLTSRRAVVWTAASAAQALEILQREHIDVLLADIAMPGEDGYTLHSKSSGAQCQSRDDSSSCAHSAGAR